eukprot:2871999-Lingulodinium_polyedra.AAC.1
MAFALPPPRVGPRPPSWRRQPKVPFPEAGAAFAEVPWAVARGLQQRRVRARLTKEAPEPAQAARFSTDIHTYMHAR